MAEGIGAIVQRSRVLLFPRTRIEFLALVLGGSQAPVTLATEESDALMHTYSHTDTDIHITKINIKKIKS